MTPVLLTFAAFAAWCLVGLALLAAVRADTASLRVTLTAPALGSCVTLLAAFLLSHAGMAMEHAATFIALGVLACAVGVLAIRRPRLPASALPVIAICAGGVALAAAPMLTFGFHWIANANDDMGNYTLSAQQLVHHGLLARIDATGLVHGKDYATTLTGLHQSGTRPGADLMLAVLSALTGRLPYEVFMPLIFSFNLCCICSAGALAMQATERWWAASVAAVLLAVSPLATFGVLQQLIAQVWGLSIGVALFALMMNPDLYRRPARLIADGVPIGILTAALVVVYVELASALAAAYALYLVVVALRKEVSVGAILRLWLPIVLITVVLLNAYLPTEIRFVKMQASSGVAGEKGVPLFAFTLVPSALPGILGLQVLRALEVAPALGLSIAVAGIVLSGVFVGCLVSARRGVGAAIVLLAFAALGVVLTAHNSAFGLYKLYMYAQPFLAAIIAIWAVAGFKRFRWLVFVPVVGLIVAQLSTQRVYVEGSRDPLELPRASARTLLPAFQRVDAIAKGPIVAESENPTLIKLEAESSRGRTLFFLGRDPFSKLLGIAGLQGRDATDQRRAARADAWEGRRFDLFTSRQPLSDAFGEDVQASESLAAPSCELVVPSGSEVVFNRRLLPEGSPGLKIMPCADAHDLLAFASSELGESFYLPERREAVSFYQLEPDYFFPGQKFASFGRYVLLRVLGASQDARLELNYTDTLLKHHEGRLPPAAVVGATRVPLPVVGDGSARVFSAPLRYQVIGGVPYLLLDLGENGQLSRSQRHGLDGLYGKSEIIDPRFLTAYVRSISLVGETEYAKIHPPLALSRFPADLGDNSLEYSGIYEDGWVGADSYVVLSGGPSAELELRAAVPAGAGKHLDVLLGGHVIASESVAPGPLNLRVHVPAAGRDRRVELRFTAAVKLHPPDERVASALLSFLGFVAAPR